MLIGKFYSRRRDKVNLNRKFPRHEDTNDQKPLNYFWPLMEKAKTKRFLKRRRKKQQIINKQHSNINYIYGFIITTFRDLY